MIRIVKPVLSVVLTLLCAVSCLDAAWVDAPHRPITDVIASTEQRPPSMRTPEEAMTDSLVLVCGVRVPDHYDWQRDTALGNGEGEVFLLENNFRKVSLRSGYAFGVSPDPDTHHIIGSDLYTDFSFADETVLKRNGEELFRYPGRESIRWIMLRDGDVHTLGVSRDGAGFSYRINGEEVLLRGNGTVIRGLHEDAGHIYFIYRRISAGVSSVFLVEDGLESRVSLPASDGTLEDLIVWLQELHILFCCPSGFDVYSSRWEGGGKKLTSYVWSDPKFLIADGEPCVCGSAESQMTHTTKTIVCRPDGTLVQFGGSGCEVLYDDGRFCALCDNGAGYVSAYMSQYKWAEIKGYRLMGDACMDCGGGHLCAALSGADSSGNPEIWIDGKETVLKMNGYLSGIRIILPRTVSLTRRNLH